MSLSSGFSIFATKQFFDLDFKSFKSNSISLIGNKELINKYLSNTKIELANIDSYGYDGDFIESQAFGYLAIIEFAASSETELNSKSLG